MRSKYGLYLLCSVAAIGFSSSAKALENGVSNYPPGSVGTNFAEFPPIPGIFVLNQTNYSSANALYDNNGNKNNAIPYKQNVYSDTIRLLVNYPGHLPEGLSLHSQLVFPIVSLHDEIFGEKTDTTGLSNITITPLIAEWNPRPHLFTTLGFDFILPNGPFSTTSPSVSTGYATYSPVLALRYDQPNGPDIGAAQRLLLNAENTNDNYKSGNAYEADFFAGWNFGPWKLGAVGGFLDQYSNDTNAAGTVQPNGNRTETLGIGPSVTYQGLLFGKIPINVNLNFQAGVYAQNTAKSNNVWLNIGFPLYAVPPTPRQPS